MDKDTTSPISEYDRFCTGYFAAPKSKYITGISLGVAKVLRTFEHNGSKTLDYICAFDKAESSGTYLGQTNITYVSSFCSQDSYIWGYNLAKVRDLKLKHPMLDTDKINYLSKNINIYSAQPLLRAFKELIGTRENRHFPFYPGTHLPVAGRSIELVGPNHIYSAVGIGISADKVSAHTFMEDIGIFPTMINQDELIRLKGKVLKDIAMSVITVGVEQKINFECVYVDIVDLKISEREVGSAIVMAPYFNIAKDAVPEGGFEKLIGMSLEDWKHSTKR